MTRAERWCPVCKKDMVNIMCECLACGAAWESRTEYDRHVSAERAAAGEDYMQSGQLNRDIEKLINLCAINAEVETLETIIEDVTAECNQKSPVEAVRYIMDVLREELHQAQQDRERELER